MPTMAHALQPLASFIKVDPAGLPYLEGVRCTSCGEVLLESRRGCPKCASIGTLEPVRLAETGRLFSYTIVHRSFPGVVTPFISAVVELDGGGFLKGNLVGADPEPSTLEFGMPVRVSFDHPKVTGKNELDLLRYVFVPGTDDDRADASSVKEGGSRV
jgi:uncharacterized OB-fold protein